MINKLSIITDQTPTSIFLFDNAAAIHDVKKFGKKYRTQHFYSVDLRTHGLKHLTLPDTRGKRNREHDTRALKRLDIKTLRQAAPKGHKVIYVWDKAGIDFMQWFKWKQAGGIYFISREKRNMELMVLTDLHYDKTNALNAGLKLSTCELFCRYVQFPCDI